MDTEFASEIETLEEDLPATIDDAAIKRMRAVAHTLDEGIPVPGTDARIGVDPIVGVLPGAGDAVTSVVSLYLVAEAARLGVSTSTLARMLTYVGVDTVVGSVPVLGTVFDAFWKANKWNVKLALEDLADEYDQADADTGPKTVTID